MAETLNNNKLFEDIKHYNEFDMEFWYARELQEVLEYSKWDNFLNVISKAVCLYIVIFYICSITFKK